MLVGEGLVAGVVVEVAQALAVGVGVEVGAMDSAAVAVDKEEVVTDLVEVVEDLVLVMEAVEAATRCAGLRQLHHPPHLGTRSVLRQ